MYSSNTLTQSHLTVTLVIPSKVPTCTAGFKISLAPAVLLLIAGNRKIASNLDHPWIIIQYPLP